MRLGRIVWDGPRANIDHKRLGELFLAKKTAESAA